MNKNIVLGLVGVVIIIMATYFLMSEDSKKVEENTKKTPEVVREVPTTLNGFFRKDLTEEERKDLDERLLSLSEIEKKVKKLLEDSYKNKSGKMGEAFMEAAMNMDMEKNELFIFVKPELMPDFDIF